MTEITPYTPVEVGIPPRVLLGVASAWVGIESCLSSILDDFKVGRKTALEFGVEYGYSTVALSNYFDTVIGVDTFLGDSCTGTHECWYEATSDRLKKYPNILLARETWQELIKGHCYDTDQFDLIHIDIEHTYEQTYGCGLWAVAHSPVVLFHDTEAWPDVKVALCDIVSKTGAKFYNWEQHAGLGILCR